ncbi:uncharacterized protein LOC127094746 [Lathyrus oleraceus]|uniref:uncharacterized protein LOC127094746 n=1 Tax=Pisum sativum TaxID=3888 RepID=UPI0021D25635|nr:uncharacterized protein LOC127094746 [Pisum sativum]
MDFGRRRTQKYTFKSPKLEDLREIGSLVVNHEDLKVKYGRLLPLLKTKMVDAVLATLVQFYDPLYQCFSFPDYQLVPILEEFYHMIGLPIPDQAPFSGLEEIPKHQDIAEAAHLRMFEIKANLTTKGGILGLPAKFLIDEARYFASMKSMDAFEAILALLIYGLFLFPNIDDFVDINAIKIFLIGNPVPTLLANVYHSVHLRNSHKGGMIICCTTLLYKWFISHLPRSTSFWDLKDGLIWSQKIMSLTHSDIDWFDRAYEGVKVIDSCGEFPNVPLHGTKGGINYNPILACRKFGYPMKDKPNTIFLESFLFKEGEDNKAFKENIVHAWRHVHKKGREVLGKLDYVSLEPYLQWVQARVVSLKMHYPRQEPLSLTVKEPSFVFMTDAEKLKITLTMMQREKDAWKNKYHIVHAENEELQRHLKKRNYEELANKKRKVQEDLFSSSIKPVPGSDNPPTLGASKMIIDKLVVENTQMKDRIKELNMKLQRGIGSPSQQLP